MSEAQVNKYDALVKACERLRAARDERHARSGAMQEAAALARNGGPRGPDAIAAVDRKHPIVHDVSDAVDEICEALDRLLPKPKKASLCGCGEVHAPGDRCGPW